MVAVLGISVNGAEKHPENLRHRYGVTSRLALLIAAVEAGDVRLRRC